MSGIYGYQSTQSELINNQGRVFNKLMEVSNRGKEGVGIACADDKNQLAVIRSSLQVRTLLKSDQYQQFLKHIGSSPVYTAIGCSNLEIQNVNTVGMTQPAIADNKKSYGVHSGIITNLNHILNLVSLPKEDTVSDAKVLVEYYSFLRSSKDIESSLYRIYDEIEGSASIALVDIASSALVLATNTGSLYYCYSTLSKSFYFASDKLFLEEALKEVKKDDIQHLKPGWGCVFSKGSLNVFEIKVRDEEDVLIEDCHQEFSVRDFSFRIINPKAIELFSIKNKLSDLKSHTIDTYRIKKIQRCTKCILPTTTPFITFDNDGVCSFCLEHQPIYYKGKDELEKMIEKYRSKNGEPDCLAAFSGGRDSSYGLHYLKKELGLNPIAYTYDWGMITDLGKRNQARMLGQLGVEHLLLSADIIKKRSHIRMNIKAWMKDPHLSMIPLFMQGDKQCEFYANQMMKKKNLNLMFFFRGNEFEKEEFKNGHCGIKDADPGGVIHHLPFKDKVKLLSFYGYRYLKNPAYFNASFWDTSLAYFSTYIQKHDYLYLWHYIPWDEELINRTLLDEYNWETSKETIQMWRTDDGSSAFYNYIYYQVQGFTENDSFRSRQVREGKLSREEALKLAHIENAPRYESLQWYFDQIGLKGTDVLKVVDNMQKLY